MFPLRKGKWGNLDHLSRQGKLEFKSLTGHLVFLGYLVFIRYLLMSITTSLRPKHFEDFFFRYRRYFNWSPCLCVCLEKVPAVLPRTCSLYNFVVEMILRYQTYSYNFVTVPSYPRLFTQLYGPTTGCSSHSADFNLFSQIGMSISGPWTKNNLDKVSTLSHRV